MVMQLGVGGEVVRVVNGLAEISLHIGKHIHKCKEVVQEKKRGEKIEHSK